MIASNNFKLLFYLASSMFFTHSYILYHRSNILRLPIRIDAIYGHLRALLNSFINHSPSLKMSIPMTLLQILLIKWLDSSIFYNKKVFLLSFCTPCTFRVNCYCVGQRQGIDRHFVDFINLT